MGLKLLPQIRKKIRDIAPSCVRLPQEVIKTENTIITIDLTQCWRSIPLESTGSAFCLFVWNSLRELSLVNVRQSVHAIVAVMDKLEHTPIEKFQEQKQRERSSTAVQYSENCVFEEDGIYCMDDHEWKKFRAADIISSRHLRGRLVDWFIRWVRRHHSKLDPIQSTLYFEYSWPVNKTQIVEIIPASTSRSLTVKNHPEWKNRTGEADVSSLYWIQRFPAYKHISLQIDSDITPISLFHCLNHQQCLPLSWVWVACLHDWSKDTIVAERQDLGDDWSDEIIPVPTTKKRKGKTEEEDEEDPKGPVFCMDLTRFYDVLSRWKAPYMPLPYRDEVFNRVCCFAVACVLGGTDFYRCKQDISPRYSFDDILSAVQRCWPWLLGTIEFWEKTGAWSLDRIPKHKQDIYLATEEALAQPSTTLDMLVRWEMHVLALQNVGTPVLNRETGELIGESPLFDELVRPESPFTQPRTIQWYQDTFKECKRKVAPSHEAMITAYKQLFFNISYWRFPFIG
jgi:hypothetical protein